MNILTKLLLSSSGGVAYCRTGYSRRGGVGRGPNPHLRPIRHATRQITETDTVVRCSCFLESLFSVIDRRILFRLRNSITTCFCQPRVGNSSVAYRCGSRRMSYVSTAYSRLAIIRAAVNRTSRRKTYRNKRYRQALELTFSHIA